MQAAQYKQPGNVKGQDDLLKKVLWPSNKKVHGLSKPYQYLEELILTLIVARLFEEKRGNIVFGISSFHPFVFPSEEIIIPENKILAKISELIYSIQNRILYTLGCITV